MGERHIRRLPLPHPAQPERMQQARGWCPGASHGGGRGLVNMLSPLVLARWNVLSSVGIGVWKQVNAQYTESDHICTFKFVTKKCACST